MDLRYRYLTRSQFTKAVSWHFFKLRAVPCSNAWQSVLESRLDITPACSVWHSVDGQGNAVQWGTLEADHHTFEVLSEGVVRQASPYVQYEAPAAYYCTPTMLTACTPDMQCMARRIAAGIGVAGTDYALVVAHALMDAVHRHIAYTPCHTTTVTTAIDVWRDPRGVCQDYAHLMLALCRALRIHARYVSGFISGEGQTHAWVEVSDGCRWLPFDPTHNLQPQQGYVKLAHGRDADDCPINRGRFYGWTTEVMTVSVQVSDADTLGT